MMTRSMSAVVLAVLLAFTASAGATSLRRYVSGQQGTALIKAHEARNVEGPASVWKSKLGGKKGDPVRPFTASSVRPLVLGSGGTVHIGFMLRGKIDMLTGKVRNDRSSIVSPR